MSVCGFALDVHETSTISRILLACLTYIEFVIVLGLVTYAFFVYMYYIAYESKKICARIYNACRNVNLVSLGGWFAFAFICTS